MARPLRIEFPGAVYHVTCRGDRQEPIYRDDVDRCIHLEVLGHAAERFDVAVLAYCQMGNHVHLVLQTRDANLSRFMRHLNGVYTQRFNRRHALAGHLFQGRFHAILVDRDAYLLTLCRYVERNPVAAGLVAAPSAWAWSSCRAHLGLVKPPAWLDCDTLHALLGTTGSLGGSRRYAEIIEQPTGADFWRHALRQQVFLGDETFVERELARATPAREVPRTQRSRPGASLAALLAQGLDEPQALYRAHVEGGATMTRLAVERGLSVSRVSRLIARAEAEASAAAAKGKT